MLFLFNYFNKRRQIMLSLGSCGVCKEEGTILEIDKKEKKLRPFCQRCYLRLYGPINDRMISIIEKARELYGDDMDWEMSYRVGRLKMHLEYAKVEKEKGERRETK
jgi:hypothetical protein